MSVLLLESGSAVLLEDGFDLLLEDGSTSFTILVDGVDKWTEPKAVS